MTLTLTPNQRRTLAARLDLNPWTLTHEQIVNRIEEMKTRSYEETDPTGILKSDERCQRVVTVGSSQSDGGGTPDDEATRALHGSRHGSGRVGERRDGPGFPEAHRPSRRLPARGNRDVGSALLHRVTRKRGRLQRKLAHRARGAARPAANRSHRGGDEGRSRPALRRGWPKRQCLRLRRDELVRTSPPSSSLRPATASSTTSS